jgi:hypothetical protein
MKKRVNKAITLNKKAQDLSIGTLILIVLGIVVLVLLVLGFSMGWENLWEKINIFGGGSSIGTVASACELAAQQDNKYGYCQEFKKVKIGQSSEYVNCLDSRLQSSIDTKLNCVDTEVTTAIQTLCNGFSEGDRKNIKINSQTCVQHFPTIYDSEGRVTKSFEELCIEGVQTNRERKVQTKDTNGNCPKEGDRDGSIVTLSKQPTDPNQICCDYPKAA